MNAIKIIDEMIEEVRNPWKEWETMHKTQVLKELRDKISSLPSDTQWIDKLEKELEEEDKDIDSLDDYYMGMSVGKSSMLNRVKKEILPNNN